MNIIRWMLGLLFLGFLSILILQSGINAINFLLSISTFVFIVDALFYKNRSL